MSTTTIPKAGDMKSSRPATPSSPVAQLQNTEQPSQPKSPHYWIPCFKFLISLFIAFSLPLTLYLILRKTNGGAGVPAPNWLAAYSKRYPRVTSQLLTYVANFFTYIVQWALSGAVGVLACGYFLTPRPIHYLDIFSALKAGGTTEGWGPPYGPLLVTGLFSVFYTLTMTSGFVGLISPFPLAIPVDIDYVGRELNLSSFEPSCYTWYNETTFGIFGPGGTLCPETVVYRNTNFTYTTCPLQGQFNEVLDSAKTSMVYRFAKNIPVERVSNLASPFPQLADTRITGGTAGTLPTGPLGVHPFTAATFPNISAAATSYNYTLNLDGVWAEVSCSYTNSSSFPITMYPAVNGTISYDLHCPGKQLLLQPVRTVDADHIINSLLLAGACVNGPEYIVYLRSFWNYDDYQQQISNGTSTVPYPPYAGIDAVKCTLAPRAGTIVATYQTDVAAFNMTPSSAPYILFNETSDMTYLMIRRAMVYTLHAISDAQTPWNGNLIAGLVRTVARTYGGLTGQEKDPMVANLVGDALKGIFEYELTHGRLVLTASDSTAPGECYRNVTGRLVEQVIGWNAQLSVTLGLLPLMILSFVGMAMIIWGIRLGGSATDFDPADHVTLIIAARKANFGEGEVEHLDEDIVQRSTMVSCTKDVQDSDVKWGLKLHRSNNQAR